MIRIDIVEFPDREPQKNPTHGTRAEQAARARAREQLVYDMRQAGAQFAEIGDALGGVTAVRARQIYLRAAKLRSSL